jgi:hypothetical protein
MNRPTNGQVKTALVRLGWGVAAALVAVLTYLAKELRADVRNLQAEQIADRVAVATIKVQLDAMAQTLGRIERKLP